MRRLALLFVLGATTSAAADSVKQLVDDAARLYEAADLAGALDKLEAAYAKSKRPDIAFGIARIHMDRGDCAQAIQFYRTFLESKPGPKSTQIATEKIAECQKILATAQPDPDPAPPPPPPIVVTPPPRAEPRIVTRPWYTDVVGDVLVVVGLGGLGAGGYWFASARSDVDRANTGGAGGVSLDEYRMLRDRADDKRLYGTIAVAAGGALLLGGVLKFALSDRTEVVPVTSAEASGVAVRGTF